MTAISDDLESRVTAFLRSWPPDHTPDRELRERRFDAGLAFVHFDVGAGGLGMPSSYQPIVDRQFLNAGAADWSDRNIVGLGMAAPTIHGHGSPEQRLLLRPLFVGEEVWCQLFSEPGAGSDLASLATMARPDGPAGYRVSGQKVWTSLAHVASRALLLARTDADAPQHEGLSYFLLDMHSEGIEVRPLRQMTGDSEFNEVFLDNVWVPTTAMLGPEGAGWRIAMTTLMNERAALSGAALENLALDRRLYTKAVLRGSATPIHRDTLMRLWNRERTVVLTNDRFSDARKEGFAGAEDSIGKLAMAELNQSLTELAIDLLGAGGMLFGSYDVPRSARDSFAGGNDPAVGFLRTRANSIEGGTSEILRNVLGERVLGLPREPRPERGAAWKDLPRG
jgi:alkylation response protein AidB-like acyl-CoA dehydrogenase